MNNFSHFTNVHRIIVEMARVRSETLHSAIHPFPCVFASNEKKSGTPNTEHTSTYRSKHFSHLLGLIHIWPELCIFAFQMCSMLDICDICGWWLGTFFVLHILILLVYFDFFFSHSFSSFSCLPYFLSSVLCLWIIANAECSHYAFIECLCNCTRQIWVMSSKR